MRLLLHLALTTAIVLLSDVNGGSAGITSKFIRTEWPSIDIPLDNEAFAVPKGHNSPQQVCKKKNSNLTLKIKSNVTDDSLFKYPFMTLGFETHSLTPQLSVYQLENYTYDLTPLKPTHSLTVCNW